MCCLRIRSITNFFFSLLLFCVPVFAQNEVAIGQFQGAADIMVAFPQDEFNDNVDGAGFGLSVDIGYVFPNLPIVAGVSGGFATYGSRSYRVPFNYKVQTVFVEMNTSNNIGLLHPFLRFQPQHGIFRPYFEGLFGLHYLWTESSVKDERDKVEIAGSTNLEDIAFSYGAGGGVMVRFYNGSDDGSDKGEMFIDLRLRYLYGGKAKYFTEKSLKEINGVLKLDEQYADKSLTNMILVMLGLSNRI